MTQPLCMGRIGGRIAYLINEEGLLKRCFGPKDGTACWAALLAETPQSSQIHHDMLSGQAASFFLQMRPRLSIAVPFLMLP